MVHQYNHETTYFGFKRVTRADKTQRVRQVFSSVAGRYDLMNDLMSLGIHRLWKYICINIAGFNKQDTIVDLAGGTGDLTIRIINLVNPENKIILADPNAAMLREARKRLIAKGMIGRVRLEQTPAETMPFADHSVDKIIIGFGFRNFTDKKTALAECLRILKPSGKLVILEFSQPDHPYFRKIYDLYSYNLLPGLGKWLADDEQSYRYLVESIRKHPNQQQVTTMFKEAGFTEIQYYTMSLGIVAVHSGIKP